MNASRRSALPRLEAIEVLRETAREFHARGWMLGTSGNLSLALGSPTPADADADPPPERFLVTASGRHKGRLGPDDFVDIDVSTGEALSSSARPSDETLIHTAIYQRTNAGAVYHVHQPAAAVVTMGPEREAHGVLTVPPLEMLKGIGLRSTDTALIPIVPNDPDIPRLAAHVGALIEGGLRVPAVLIARHGVYTWGVTPDAALRHIEILAYLFDVVWRWEQCSGRDSDGARGAV